MPANRHFLGWDAPFLPTAAKWLRDRHATEAGRCDMEGVTVVLPGARAGRRLLERLAAGPGLLTPPRIITVGQLPELLYTPQRPVATPLQSTLSRAHALRSADRDILVRIIPRPPADADLQGWLALAHDLAKLDEELSAEALTIDDVIARCEARADFDDSPRWRALARLQQEYERSLEERGLTDVHRARFAALGQPPSASPGPIVLLALTDLSAMVRRLLTPFQDHVACLVHAPESECEGFDRWGCVIPEQWRGRNIDTKDEMVHMVNRPRDQAMEVVRLIGSPDDAASDGTLRGRFAAAQVTIGLGDETLAGPVGRALELSGIASHHAGQARLIHARPLTLLRLLAAFADGLRLDDLASLLRHPDIELHLRRSLADDETPHSAGDELPRTITHWLTLLDEYLSEHLSGRSTGDWLGDEAQGAQLKRVHEACVALLPEHLHLRQSLPNWSGPVAAVLRTIYAGHGLDPADAESAPILDALEILGEALREQAGLDPADPTVPILSFSDVVALLLWRLGDQPASAVEEPADHAVELLGWLELMLDEAPALIITGFNEHHIPQSTAGDAFLPHHLRSSLGLVDNDRRLARDAAALTAMLHSKHHLAIIAGRQGQDGEPLSPSRLLLTGEADAVAKRLLRFYPKHLEDEPAPTHALITQAGGNRFLIPAPRPPRQPVSRMRVTAFRDYLACPYRFYLKHVLRLRAMDDQAVEMDGLMFGNLAHEVLRHFAKGSLRDSTDVSAIRSQLTGLLHDEASRTLGDQPPVAARLQIIQLEERLHAFAGWQAQQVNEGWRIDPDLIEWNGRCEFALEDGTMEVKGRIDRIDVHQGTGVRRIIDYKTGDKGDTPEKTHRKRRDGEQAWIDLQLPLYHGFARAHGVKEPIELGYVLLSRKTSEVGFVQAEWTDAEIADGIDCARRIAAAVRAGIFWPPAEPPEHEDEMAAICMDEYDERNVVIAQVTRGMEGRP